jgi:hypothetical protein
MLFELCPPKSPSKTTQAMGASTVQKARFLKLETVLRFSSPWPAGTYLRAFRSGFAHGVSGHPCYLFGEQKEHGW